MKNHNYRLNTKVYFSIASILAIIISSFTLVLAADTGSTLYTTLERDGAATDGSYIQKEIYLAGTNIMQHTRKIKPELVDGRTNSILPNVDMSGVSWESASTIASSTLIDPKTINFEEWKKGSYNPNSIPQTDRTLLKIDGDNFQIIKKVGDKDIIVRESSKILNSDSIKLVERSDSGIVLRETIKNPQDASYENKPTTTITEKDANGKTTKITLEIRGMVSDEKPMTIVTQENFNTQNQPQRTTTTQVYSGSGISIETKESGKPTRLQWTNDGKTLEIQNSADLQFHAEQDRQFLNTILRNGVTSVEGITKTGSTLEVIKGNTKFAGTGTTIQTLTRASSNSDDWKIRSLTRQDGSGTYEVTVQGTGTLSSDQQDIIPGRDSTVTTMKKLPVDPNDPNKGFRYEMVAAVETEDSENPSSTKIEYFSDGTVKKSQFNSQNVLISPPITYSYQTTPITNGKNYGRYKLQDGVYVDYSLSGQSYYDENGVELPSDRTQNLDSLSQQAREDIDRRRLSEDNSNNVRPGDRRGTLASASSREFFQDYFQAADIASGFAGYSSLFFSDNFLNEWKNKVDEAFASAYLGKEYWTSAICNKYADGKSQGIAYVDYPPRLSQLAAFVEAMKTPSATNERGETTSIYRIEFSVRNGDWDKDPNALDPMRFNVILIKQDGSEVSLYQQRQEVKKGQRLAKVGQSSIVQESSQIYTEICLEFEQRPYKWRIDGNRLCNQIAQGDVNPTVFTTTSSGTAASGSNTNSGGAKDAMNSI